MTGAIIFVLGLLFGSLANVILLRFNTGESLVFGGSRCFSCMRRLDWYELIPIFSFLFLRARCRTCKSGIGWQYPLIELGTGVLFLVVYSRLFSFQFSILNFQSIFNFQKYLILNTGYFMLLIGAWYFLWLSALYDFRHKILPDFFNFGALALSVIAFIAPPAASSGYSSIIHDSRFTIHVLAAGAMFLFFFSLWFLSKGRWMGLGDAKFVLAFGFLLSPAQALLGAVLAFWLGAIVGVSLIFFQKLLKSDFNKYLLLKSDFNKYLSWRSEIAFGPFLFLGGIISFSFGDKILNWYLGLF